MTYNVMAIDNVDQKGCAILEANEAITLTAQGKPSRDEVMALIPNAHAVIIRSGTQMDAELLAKADNLKVVVRAGVGVDNVDLDAATKKGVVVMNVPSGNTVSTAEYAFGLMLALARHIPQGVVSMQAGRWDRKKYMGVELRGKTLGLVGLGRIGREVAKRALAFQMTVIAHDPYLKAADVAELGVKLVDLDTLYAEADFISLHAAVTDETRGLINAASIAKMKDGLRIVNTARGALINDADLAEAIKSGKIGGVAMDVYATEPPPEDHPLVGLDGVIHTPHLAASTSDAQVIVAVEGAKQIINALVDGTFVNVVNPAVQGA
jgi:D-3-phosphoglycerate dehydrogenase / 2-oxoglutarate reductase